MTLQFDVNKKCCIFATSGENMKIIDFMKGLMGMSQAPFPKQTTKKKKKVVKKKKKITKKKGKK